MLNIMVSKIPKVNLRLVARTAQILEPALDIRWDDVIMGHNPHLSIIPRSALIATRPENVNLPGAWFSLDGGQEEMKAKYEWHENGKGGVLVEWRRTWEKPCPSWWSSTEVIQSLYFSGNIWEKDYQTTYEFGTWKIKSNLDQILGGEDLVRHVKSLRIGWLGHVERMEGKRTPKYLLYNNIIGIRKKGRSRKRWTY